MRLTAALLACALASCQEPGEPLAGASPAWRDALATWTHPAPLPAFPLVDQAGRPFSLAALAGKPVLVAFVFTRCPVADACPLTMSRLKDVQALAPALQILVVTLDPAHDTPAVLDAYGRRHGLTPGALTLATGDAEVTAALASLFNVVALRRGDGDIAHPVKLALLDKDLAPVRTWTDNDFTAKEIVDASAPQ